MFKRFFRNGFKNGANILFQEQKTILSGASVIALMVMLSAILGLVRKRLYAGLLAAGPDYDVLVAAFKIPDLIFQLLVAGSLNAAFIPLFSFQIAKNKAEDAWKFASAVLNLVLIFFVFLAGLGFVLAPILAVWLAPGFTVDQQEQLIHLMRIMFLSPIFLGLSSFIGGMVQSFKRFLLPFFSPVAYNLGAILGIMFLYPPLGLEGMAWGVLLGSVLHLLINLPALRYFGFRYSFYLSWKDQSVRELLRLSLPRTLWTSVLQIKEIVITGLASLLQTGSLSVLDYGQTLARFPVLLIGASISQASLPTLSEFAARGQMDRFRKIFLNSFLQILYLILPISVVLIVLKIPVVRLVFGTGNFGWWETVVTSWVLAIFSVSLFAQVGKELVIRAFYALKRTDIPVAVGIGTIFLGVILSILLTPYLEIRGLVLGISVSFVVEFVVLLFFLLREIELEFKKLLGSALKIVISAGAMALAMYLPVQILDEVFIDTTKVVNLLVLVWVVLTFGSSVYLLMTWFLGCKEIRIFVEILLKIKSWREALTSAQKASLRSLAVEGEEMEGIE